VSTLFDKILAARGLQDEATRAAFLNPQYDDGHDPFLLPDMNKAVTRLLEAHQNGEHITIYGDYDIDGLTATTVLLDAFGSFGFGTVDTFMPNRFIEGYGLTIDAIEKIAKTGTQLIVTVDCGSLSEKEIIRAGELGMDVIVTDHHNVLPMQPPAIAVVNPKRLLQDNPDEYEDFILKNDSTKKDELYPFLDLPGVGVAFKLVQALQTRLDGLEKGHEKWLLDLVALGTVCDVVTLRDENRMHVYYGLKVLSKTRRPGLTALMTISKIDSDTVNTRSLGFGLGPRMNAAGRLETAQISLDMLRASTSMEAYELAERLDIMNTSRRSDQDKIFKEAIKQAEEYRDDNVLVVSAPDWNHGIIGIVAAKLLERYKKPTYVLQEMGEESKGSARSYGDFSAADAIRASDNIITKGGGHKLAAGVTMPTSNIAAFRQRVNEFYDELNLKDQELLLLPTEDCEAAIEEVDETLIAQLSTLEPFGSANPQPILKSTNLTVVGVRKMGTDNQHVKIEVVSESRVSMQLLAFNAPAHFFVNTGEVIQAWYQPDVNEWQGRRSIEGRLLRLENQ
jgi:single-stranded-DNA-specific exonuclease